MKKSMGFVLALLALTTACEKKQEEKNNATLLGNPASANCAKQGGQLSIEKRGDGGEFGVCYFEDNQQCEEWALLKGNCPKGGVKVTGYTTPEATYCAITGGTYKDPDCTLPGGTVCNATAYYDGLCK